MTATFDSTSQIMRQVIYALILGIGTIYTFFGWGVIVQIVLAVLVAVVVEAGFLKIRKLPIRPSITDGSAVLTGILLAISIPSIAPWWVIVIGVSFAIIFGKQLYGGLGNNPFNPAMLGYAFLLISYPLPMTTWASEFINLTQTLDLIFNLNPVDALSGATRLDDIKIQLALGKTMSELNAHSSAQAWVNIGFLFGGLYLLVRGVVFWHLPSAFLLGVVASAFVLSIGDSEHYLPAQNHLMLGGTMLAAFFIITDPVTASTTPKGRLIYGFLCGVLVVVIRTFGGYPDGIAFAVLLMNMTVSLIDYYTQPKVFGK